MSISIFQADVISKLKHIDSRAGDRSPLFATHLKMIEFTPRVDLMTELGPKDFQSVHSLSLDS